MTDDDTQERFDDSCQEATLAVIECFEWAKLPEDNNERLALLYRLNDAITAIMEDYV